MQGSVTPPTNVCRQRRETKQINRSKWNVYHIIPHILTKKKNTYNNTLFYIWAEIWAFICWYTYTCRNGTKSAGFATEKLKISLVQHIRYCHSLILYWIIVFFQTIKYVRDWADMIFKPKRWPKWSFFILITTGARGRFKKKNHTRLQITWHISCLLLHPRVQDFAKWTETSKTQMSEINDSC